MIFKRYIKDFSYKSLKNIALFINTLLKPLSIKLIKLKKDLDFPIDATKRDIEIIKCVLNSNPDKKLSMVPVDRLMAVISATKYIIENNIEGDFVECGVWRGGNLIIFQKFIEKYNLQKKIYAYDTFEGMSNPEEIDRTFDGKSSIEALNKIREKKIKRDENILVAECSIEKVLENFKKFSQKENLICIKGKVEETLKLKDNLPNKISILRLDTDWYSSTKIELEILFPLLEKNGILIIDDYGYWQGAKKAVDEYFKDKQLTMFKIDFTGRLIIKS